MKPAAVLAAACSLSACHATSSQPAPTLDAPPTAVVIPQDSASPSPRAPALAVPDLSALFASPQWSSFAQIWRKIDSYKQPEDYAIPPPAIR
jgi:hypothetical protein